MHLLEQFLTSDNILDMPDGLPYHHGCIIHIPCLPGLFYALPGYKRYKGIDPLSRSFSGKHLRNDLVL